LVFDYQNKSRISVYNIHEIKHFAIDFYTLRSRHTTLVAHFQQCPLLTLVITATDSGRTALSADVAAAKRPLASGLPQFVIVAAHTLTAPHQIYKISVNKISFF
jgi:hypothetical protein